MNTILSKLRGHTVKLDGQSSQFGDAVQDEKALADEQDSVTGDISGMLTISDESLKSPTDPTKDICPYQVPCEGSYSVSSNVTFEVISAEVIRDGRSGHVRSIVVKGLTGIASNTALAFSGDSRIAKERYQKRSIFVLSNGVVHPKMCDGCGNAGRKGNDIEENKNYTVLINPNKEALRSTQSLVVRRYSDFEHLHHQLKKRFPVVMSQISFPRKVLTGNFTSETIAKRSTAFEQYLAHLFSFFEVRYCSEFMEFFVQDDYAVAVSCFLSKDFSSAAMYFERTLPVLEKLYGDSHPRVFHCLCGLVISYTNLEKYSVAQSCAEMALRCSGAADDETMTSLILATIRLCWTLGKDKQGLEKKLDTMRSHGVNIHSVKDLHDILEVTFFLKNKNAGT